MQSIYFGGGTPSTLKIEHIESVLNAVYSNFTVDKNAEITFESNPVSLKIDYLKGLKSLGINRLSIGVQSFMDSKLKILGRLHDSQKAFKAVKNAQDTGFKNISIDLIYGLNETEKEIEYELESAVSLDIQHISIYMLSIEKNTKFEKMAALKQLKVSNNDEMADFYLFISKYLEDEGFEHYEISNFAKKGFKSSHNCSYWLGYDYRSFGVSASSFVEGIRFKNSDSLDFYLNGKNIVETAEKLEKEERMREEFVLLLRTAEGVDVGKFNKKYKIDIEKYYKNELSKFKKLNLIKKEKRHITLNSAEAMVVSNSIFSEFI